MDFANINALNRAGIFPAPRVAVSRSVHRAITVATQDATTSARNRQPPAEQVLQGELLQKRRTSSSYDTADLLDTMRAMDRVLRDTSSTDATPPRDTRRAIATYTQQMTIPGTLAGTPAAGAIDYFV